MKNSLQKGTSQISQEVHPFKSSPAIQVEFPLTSKGQVLGRKDYLDRERYLSSLQPSKKKSNSPRRTAWNADDLNIADSDQSRTYRGTNKLTNRAHHQPSIDLNVVPEDFDHTHTLPSPDRAFSNYYERSSDLNSESPQSPLTFQHSQFIDLNARSDGLRSYHNRQPETSLSPIQNYSGQKGRKTLPETAIENELQKISEDCEVLPSYSATKCISQDPELSLPSKRKQAGSSAAEDQLKETKKSNWALDNPTHARFCQAVSTFCKQSFIQQPKKSDRPKEQHNLEWITLEQARENKKVFRQCHLAKKINEYKPFLEAQRYQPLPKPYPSYIVEYYATIIVGNKLFNKLRLVEAEADLLLELHTRWHTQQPTSASLYKYTRLLYFIDYSNKSLLTKIAYYSKMYDPPLYPEEKLIELQHGAYENWNAFWRRADIFETDPRKQDKLLKDLLATVPVHQSLPQAASIYSWKIFWHWAESKIEPDDVPSWHSAIRNRILQEALYNIEIEGEAELLKIDFKIERPHDIF
ncbi:hypothetical protein O181_039212 [Austropuccinia psidii MF-1]|uniref:Uncharacterized protein n=1 Tax=Austropuccinia psidii MF-1 TaxID=1389203 RepID=A0A9Q3HCN8_9BASI|nr:hypothetical protein [Austropuccinia psidii MF-1]